jgi:hypothetical protein
MQTPEATETDRALSNSSQISFCQGPSQHEGSRSGGPHRTCKRQLCSRAGERTAPCQDQEEQNLQLRRWRASLGSANFAPFRWSDGRQNKYSECLGANRVYRSSTARGWAGGRGLELLRLSIRECRTISY